MSGNRRQALIDAAFRGIAEHGLEGLRLRAPAAEAGIDHSTLHHHFATKQELLTAVLHDATQRLWTTFPDDGTPDARLTAHLVGLGQAIRAEPDLFLVLAEFDLRGQRDPAIAEIIERVDAGWRGVLTALWQGGSWETNSETAVELVIATVKGVRLLPDQAERVLTLLAQKLNS